MKPQTIEGPIPTATSTNNNELCHARPSIPEVPPATSDTSCSAQEVLFDSNPVNSISTEPRHVAPSEYGPSSESQEAVLKARTITQGKPDQPELHRDERCRTTLDTSNMQADLSVAVSHTYHHTIDPSTITFSRDIDSNYVIDSFFDIDVFNLDMMETDHLQNLAQTHELKISGVESNSESDLTEISAGSPTSNSDVEIEAEADLTEKPARIVQHDIPDVESESEPEYIRSTMGSSWRKVDDGAGGRKVVKFGISDRSRKRKIDDVDTEPEEEIEKSVGQDGTGTLKSHQFPLAQPFIFFHFQLRRYGERSC